MDQFIKKQSHLQTLINDLAAQIRTIVIPSDGAIFDVDIRSCTGFIVHPYACHYLIGMENVVTQSLEIIKYELPRFNDNYGTYRVPPLVFSRLSRGGKSTILSEVFKKLKLEAINCILITFNGYVGFRRRIGETQKSCILRLIASQLVSTIPDDQKQNIECSHAVLDDYIGETNFVLLIDELNVLSDGNPLDAEAGHFLREIFLDRANRYLVFTTHVPLDLDQFSSSAHSYNMPPSIRGVYTVPMPEETDLTELWKMDGCNHKITPAEVCLYGGIPSLIYAIKQMNEISPSQRFQMNKPIYLDNYSLLNELITELVIGDRNLSHTNLRQFDKFSSTTSPGKVRWPLCYTKLILTLCSANHISQSLINCIESIEVMTRTIESGIDWEIIVKLSLILRCCHQNIHGNQFPFPDVIPWGIKPVVLIYTLFARSAAEAFAEISHHSEAFNEHVIRLFFPCQATFPTFDGFITYQQPEKMLYVIGVQMKLGKGCPKDHNEAFNWVSKGYVLRGHPANKSFVSDFWHYLSDAEVETLLGYSLCSLRPRHWPQEPAFDKMS